MNWKEEDREVEEEGDIEEEGEVEEEGEIKEEGEVEEEGEVKEEGEGQGRGEVVDIPLFQVQSLGSPYNVTLILPHPHCSLMSKLVTVLNFLHTQNQCILSPTFLMTKYWGML